VLALWSFQMLAALALPAALPGIPAFTWDLDFSRTYACCRSRSPDVVTSLLLTCQPCTCQTGLNGVIEAGAPVPAVADAADGCVSLVGVQVALSMV
jgi:hypothetical protein